MNVTEITFDVIDDMPNACTCNGCSRLFFMDAENWSLLDDGDLHYYCEECAKKNSELIEHYNFYADNCTDDETPLTYKEWVREYREDLLSLMDLMEEKSCQNS